MRSVPNDKNVIHSGRGLREFAGTADAREYLRRVIRLLGAEMRPVVEPTLPSSLGLPEALGYLDAVWRARYGTHLLRCVRPATAAKLAAPCASSDEFDARMSALADVVAQFQVDLPPDEQRAADEANEKSLGRLRRRLQADLEAAAASRTSEAIFDLRTAVRIRVGGQHSGAASELRDAFARFGLAYPPQTPQPWGGAWEQIRARCTAAINAIREELEAAEEPANPSQGSS